MKKTLSVVAATLMFSAVAQADTSKIEIQPAPVAEAAQAQPAFEELDVNQDAMISLDEAQGHPLVLEQFQQADADKNQQLSQEEYQQLLKG